MSEAKGPWVTQLRNPATVHPSHTVIVDKVVDGIVYLSDPWNPEKGFGTGILGAETTIAIEEFAKFWQNGQSAFIFIK